jgi:dTDP-4-amino-4,6-dideoxygalactose transaminase
VVNSDVPKEQWLGGEMELRPDALCAPEVGGLPQYLQSCPTITSGRTGLKLIARGLKTSQSATALLPSYLCESMVQPFLEEDVDVHFYDVDIDLTIDSEDLLRRADSIHPTMVLFVNYFGFPVSDRESETLNRIKEQSWLIEDCAQGSLVEQEEPIVGEIGHFVLTSFRKYLPVPDGGLVINRTDVDLPRLLPDTDAFVRYELLGKFLRHEFIHGGLEEPEVEQAYLTFFKNAEGRLNDHIPLHSMSEISEKLLRRINLSSVMDRRRSNFSYLLRAFDEEPLCSIGTPLLNDLPGGVSPLVFPILVSEERRDALRKHLLGMGVFCPVHWPLPKEVKASEFEQAGQLSRGILGLPIDQRYDENDMGSLTERLLSAWEQVD